MYYQLLKNYIRQMPALTSGYLWKMRTNRSYHHEGPPYEFINFINKRRFNPPILLAGYPKSGNTYIRFVYFHLLNIIKNNNDQVLTYQDLRDIQHHTIEEFTLDEPNYTEMPLFFRTHNGYHPYYQNFKLIYVYRNPLDCMVSNYFFKEKDRPWRIINKDLIEKIPKFYWNTGGFIPVIANVKKLFKESLRYYFPDWCMHIKRYIGTTPHIISYESLMCRPWDIFYSLFNDLGIVYESSQLETALELSSFESIKKMESKEGANAQTSAKKHGKNFAGKFARSGKVGQWKEYFDEDDLYYVERTMKKYGIWKKLSFIYQ